MLLEITIESFKFYTRLSLYLLIGFGLVYFIINSIIKDNSNLVFKGFINSLVSLFFILLFTICLIIDLFSNKLSQLGLYPYIYIIAISLLYGLIFGVGNIISGKKRFQRLSFTKIKPSINRSINQFVYVVFKCDNKVILDKNKDNYVGFIRKMDKNHLFKDEIIRNICKEYNINIKYDELKEMGVCTVGGKKPNLYYCYLIDLVEVSNELLTKQVIDAYEIVNLEMTDIDKQIILRTLMRQEFNIMM